MLLNATIGWSKKHPRELEIERRWKAEQLKPQIDLKYNALTESLGEFKPEDSMSKILLLELM